MDTWPVVRSPSDVLRGVVAAVLLLALLFVQWLWGRALVDFTGELFTGLSAMPAWLVDVIVIVTRLLAVVALVGGLVIAVQLGRVADGGHGRPRGGDRRGLILLLEGIDPRSGTTAVTVSDSLGPLIGDRLPDRGRARHGHGRARRPPRRGSAAAPPHRLGADDRASR